MAVLQQMTGRAGWGSRPGEATLIVKQGDSWDVVELRDQLETYQLPAPRSVFDQGTGSGWNRGIEPPMAKAVLSFLARCPDEKLTTPQVEKFIANTMNGAEVVAECLRDLAGKICGFLRRS
ncbi:MAG: hypothetical protein J0M04_19945 [Verrucomicrobia bacterium]|nr:hypothetical protein [Verrucomicrobiota bacterium]